MMSGRDRLAYELPTEAFDDVRDSVPTGEQVSTRRRPRLSVAERYRIADLGLHLHGLRWIDDVHRADPVQLCAVYQSRDISPRDLRATDVREADRRRAGHPERDPRVHDSVFVDVVQVSDERERPTDCPSLVRLAFLDKCPVFGADPLQIPLAFLFELLWRVEDRELVTFTRSRTDHRELPDQVIESGSEVVEDVAHDHAEPRRRIERRLAMRANANYLLAGIRVRFHLEQVALLFDEPTRFTVEGFQMIPGPRYLLPAAV